VSAQTEHARVHPVLGVERVSQTLKERARTRIQPFGVAIKAAGLGVHGIVALETVTDLSAKLGHQFPGFVIGRTAREPLAITR